MEKSSLEILLTSRFFLSSFPGSPGFVFIAGAEANQSSYHQKSATSTIISAECGFDNVTSFTYRLIWLRSWRLAVYIIYRYVSPLWPSVFFGLCQDCFLPTHVQHFTLVWQLYSNFLGWHLGFSFLVCLHTKPIHIKSQTYIAGLLSMTSEPHLNF